MGVGLSPGRPTISEYEAHDHDVGDPTQVDHSDLLGVTPSQHHAVVTLGAGSDPALTLTGQELTLADVLTPAEHTAIGDASPHHTRYTDAEAVAAVEAADPLNLAGSVYLAAGKVFRSDGPAGSTADEVSVIEFTTDGGGTPSWKLIKRGESHPTEPGWVRLYHYDGATFLDVLIAKPDGTLVLGSDAGVELESNLTVAAGITLDGVDVGVHAAGTAKAQHTAGVGDHTHASAGAEGSQLDAANTHGSPSADTHHAQKSGRATTRSVAANDSSSAAKLQADVVCDGVNDEVEILAACANGGTILLLKGTYVIGAPILNIYSSFRLVGEGPQTILQNGMGKFTATINGIPSVTNVPYTGDVGEANVKVGMRLYNLTQNSGYENSVEIESIDTGANTVTVTADSPNDASTWNDGDTIEARGDIFYSRAGWGSTGLVNVHIQDMMFDGGTYANSGIGIHTRNNANSDYVRVQAIRNGAGGFWGRSSRVNTFIDCIFGGNGSALKNLRGVIIDSSGSGGCTVQNFFGGRIWYNHLEGLKANGGSGNGYIDVLNLFGTVVESNGLAGTYDGLMLINGRACNIWGYFEANSGYGVQIQRSGAGYQSQGIAVGGWFEGLTVQDAGVFANNCVDVSIIGGSHFNTHVNQSINWGASAINCRIEGGCYSNDTTPVTDSGTRNDKSFTSHNLRAQRAACSASLTLTNANQDVAGATLTLAEIGSYLIHAVFDMQSSVAGGVVVIGELILNSVAQEGQCLLDDNVTRATVAQQWLVTTTAANWIAKLQARKLNAAGTSTIGATHTTIAAIRVA